MGHNISALMVQGEIQLQAVKEWDLIIEQLPFEIKLAYIDHYYTACWQELKKLENYLPISTQAPLLFPREIVLWEIAKELKGEVNPTFAIIYTDYLGGIGTQFAQMFLGAKNPDPKITSINQALRKFGVKAVNNQDEFDTIGLGNCRHNPEYLEKYVDLADELGV